MRVAVNTKSVVLLRAWLDAGTNRLCVDFGKGMTGSIPFGKIPDEDFESATPVVGLKVGQKGAVVVCKHQDGAESWLPADMFLPGGFTPSR